ncbi:MAG: signal peptidase I [Hyphomicrobiales bacterium]|jgi:signal peptidase I
MKQEGTHPMAQDGSTDEATAREPEKKKSELWDTIVVLLQAFAIALVIRTFLFQPFVIPSSSMVGTLLIGDYLFANKFAYGFSQHSLPFSPDVFDGRILGSDPQRGDVAVFKLPSDGSTDYIKRVIGLPGDSVEVRNGVVFINGEEVERERIDDFIHPETGEGVAQYRETLPNGVSYNVLDLIDNSMLDTSPEPFVVPEGHYFMMGDNRDNSSDSRTALVGFVPLENFVGRADLIFFSIAPGSSPWQVWRWPSDARFDRMFDGI